MPDDRESAAALADDICWDAIQAAPEGWRRLDFQCRATGSRYDLVLICVMPDGSQVPVEPPGQTVDKFMEMRRLQYIDTGLGTWLSARFIIEPGPNADQNCNWLFDPHWQPDLPVEIWQEELAAFPRDDDHIPDWMRARLAGKEPSFGSAGEIGGLSYATSSEFTVEHILPIFTYNAPSDWTRITGSYRALGDHVEFPPPMVWGVDGSVHAWTPPPELAHAIDRLRAGMYYWRDDDPERGRGTWFSADFQVTFQYPPKISFQYHWDEEPEWSQEPGAEDARSDLARFPRTEADLPDWLRGRAALPETR